MPEIRENNIEETGGGFSPIRAHATAVAAVQAAGGEVPAWLHEILRRVAIGEIDGDSAVAEAFARLRA